MAGSVRTFRGVMLWGTLAFDVLNVDFTIALTTAKNALYAD